MRQFMDLLRARGALLEVDDELSPRFEVTCAMEELDRRLGPAVLFRRVAGHSVPILANLFSRREHIPWALGVPEGEELSAWYQRVLPERRAPVIGAGPAPAQEVAEDILDLDRAMPLLTHYTGDASPYLSSAVAIARDPITGRRGMGIHRIQIKGPDRFGIYLNSPPLGAFFREARPAGLPMELALVITPDPITLLASIVPAEPGDDKFEVAGALAGRPIELTQCRTINVQVPAAAEFVIEAVLDTTRTETDGPFGESLGYYLTTQSPVARVRAITHRAEPIYHSFLPFGNEVSELMGFTMELGFLPELRRRFPRLRQVRYLQLGTLAIVCLDKQDDAEVMEVGRAVIDLARALKAVVVVDADIDPWKEWDLDWALSTRFQPARDLLVLEDQPGFSLDPSIDEQGRTSKVIVDATVPAGRRERFERVGFPPEARARVERVLAGVLNAAGRR